ncbi:ribose/galactose ABC transporter permease [Spiroplasma corruscae]|uniref:Ribose/galactose ABC transporter permease n=1 Tax=Spiroplasma corruscae TaxID=216934 RepID=A0A222ENJ9_9MOLU|nr:hypothetical protein [Spiroplasma corruscae]ASP28086.1 ribose/galactose ABC transporter permease [Spiroplasma corruscae]
MKFSTSRWIKKQHLINSLKSDKTKKSLSVAKASLYSILFGLLIGIIIILANGEDGFAFIFSSIGYSLRNSSSTFLPSTINYFSTYALMGIGLALGFKIGIFNMGGTGQAVIGMVFSVLAIGNKASAEGVGFKDVDNSFVINVFLIFVFSGIAISLISGILKISFNIHEVVTTVMLNWIVWIFANWIFDRPEWVWSSNHVTQPLNTNWLSINGNTWLFGVILTIISVILVYILVNLTTFGYKFKVSGKQPTAAKYAGINIKYYILLTTALQGLFISMGGFIYYMTIQLSISTGKISELPTIGFDAIPIALVAFNNVVGILPVAMFWAMLKNGSGIAKSIEFPLLSKDVSTLVFGAITYGAGISALFFKLRIYEYLYKNFFIFYQFEVKKNFYITFNKVWSLRFKKLLYFKDDELRNLKKSIKDTEYSKSILILKQEISNLKKTNNNSVIKEKSEELENLINKNKALVKKCAKQYKIEKQDFKNNVKFEIRQLKERFSMFNEESILLHKKYSISGLRKKISNQVLKKKYELLNSFVISFNNYKTKVKDSRQKLKLDLKNKQTSKEERLNLKKLLLNNIQKWKEELESKNKISLDEFNKYRIEQYEKLKKSINEIKEKFLIIKKDFKEKKVTIKNTSSDKKQKFFEKENYINKITYYNKRCEVVKSYGS